MVQDGDSSLSIGSSYTMVWAEFSPGELKVQQAYQRANREFGVAIAKARALPGCFEAQHQLIQLMQSVL